MSFLLSIPVSLPWANLLTGSRVLLAPICAWACYAQQWSWAALLFTLAALSDFYDGKVARAQGKPTNLGGLFDHATDAWFVALTLGACALDGRIHPWLAPLIVIAFIQYSADSKALAGAQLRANWLGRMNGIAYYVLAGICIGVGLLQPLWSGWLPATFETLAPYYLSFVLVASTVLSMGNRLITWWQLRRR